MYVSLPSRPKASKSSYATTHSVRSIEKNYEFESESQGSKYDLDSDRRGACNSKYMTFLDHSENISGFL